MGTLKNQPHILCTLYIYSCSGYLLGISPPKFIGLVGGWLGPARGSSIPGVPPSQGIFHFDPERQRASLELPSLRPFKIPGRSMVH